MNNEEMPTMDGIVAVTKYLVAIWRRSKCPDEAVIYLNVRSANTMNFAKDLMN